MSWFVPGRIEVLGKHTDYAGGRSLLVATEQGVTATVSDLPDAAVGTVEAHSSASPDPVVFVVGKSLDLPAGHWGKYVQTVVDRLTLNFGELKPARVEIDSTLPLASGMSSSSALIVAVALALADQNGLWDLPQWKENITDQLDLAGYAATIENGADFKGLKGSSGVGTFGGSQD
ncbi:MAG: galactokinase family protein, partial [Scrofimicrobium sp.]